MRKILFIIPPVLPYNELQTCGNEHFDTYLTASIPLGTLSIAKYLKRNSVDDISIVDLNIALIKAQKVNNLVTFIENVINTTVDNGYKPDVVAIPAIFNSTFAYLGIIGEAVKALIENAIVVAGGGLPTNLYDQILEHVPSVDALCYGEGEIPVYELMTSPNMFQYMAESEQWVTREKLINRKFEPKFNLIENINIVSELPYELINFDDYQGNTRAHGNRGEKVASVMTSRGCPFKCCFCASHSVHGRKIRLIDADNVINEIEKLVKLYGVKYILIEDDHFLIDKERAISILKRISELNIHIEFPNGLAVYAIDEEIAKYLKLAGTKMVTLAIESGSERVLQEIIHKPLKLSMVAPVVHTLRQYGLYVRAFFIIGFPGETVKDIEMTVEFIKGIGLNWAVIMIATPIAGSELYKICKDKNYLTSNNFEKYHYGQGNIQTENFSPEYIEKKRYLMNLDINFVNNYDMLNGHFSLALCGFLDVINRVPRHAFALYYTAYCYKMLEDTNQADLYLKKYYEVIGEDEKWAEYAREFKLPLV